MHASANFTLLLSPLFDVINVIFVLSIREIRVGNLEIMLEQSIWLSKGDRSLMRKHPLDFLVSQKLPIHCLFTYISEPRSVLVSVGFRNLINLRWLHQHPATTTQTLTILPESDFNAFSGTGSTLLPFWSLTYTAINSSPVLERRLTAQTS